MMNKKISLFLFLAVSGAALHAESLIWTLDYAAKETESTQDLENQMLGIISDLNDSQSKRGVQEVFASFLNFIKEAQDAVLAGLNLTATAQSFVIPSLTEVNQDSVAQGNSEATEATEAVQEAAVEMIEAVEDSINQAVEVVAEEVVEEVSYVAEELVADVTGQPQVAGKTLSIIISVTSEEGNDEEAYQAICQKLSALSDRINENLISG